MIPPGFLDLDAKNPGHAAGVLPGLLAAGNAAHALESAIPSSAESTFAGWLGRMVRVFKYRTLGGALGERLA